MIYIILIWTILTIISHFLGCIILQFFHSICFTKRIGEFFILTIWLGIIGLTIIFLSLSFFVPISEITGIIVSLLIVAYHLFKLKKNRAINQYWNCLKPIQPIHIGIYSVVAITVASLITKPMEWFDTGLYHWQSIKWLSNFGTVTGIGLINSKLAFNAGWFAFSAPLNVSVLGSHIGAVSNGFIFFIAVIHLLITSKYLSQKANYIHDWFIAIYYLVIISTFIGTIFAESPILISYSPDIPINFLIGIIAWLILLISNIHKFAHNPVNITLILLFLALGSVTIKLTALPLIIVTFLFYLFNSSTKIKNLLISGLLCLILLLPMFTYSIKTSGCLIYPSSKFCFDLPWTLNKNIITNEVRAITGIEKKKSGSSYFKQMLQKRWKWFYSSTKLQIIILLFTLSLICSILLIKKYKIQKNNYLWLVLLGVLGMLFILFTTPLLRFGLGYFIIIICFFIGDLFNKKIRYESNYLSLKNKRVYLFISIILISKFLITNLKITNLLIPPLIPSVKSIEVQMNDFKYIYPDYWTARCWDALLPCAPVPIQNNVELKEADKGISKGFVYKTITTDFPN